MSLGGLVAGLDDWLDASAPSVNSEPGRDERVLDLSIWSAVDRNVSDTWPGVSHGPGGAVNRRPCLIQLGAVDISH